MKRTPIQIGDRVIGSRGRRHVAIGWVHDIMGPDTIRPAYLIGGKHTKKRQGKVIGWYSRAKRISDARFKHFGRLFDRLNGKLPIRDQIWLHLIELKKSRSSSH